MNANPDDLVREVVLTINLSKNKLTNILQQWSTGHTVLCKCVKPPFIALYFDSKEPEFHVIF